MRRWIAWLVTERASEVPAAVGPPAPPRRRMLRAQTVLAVSLTIAGAVGVAAIASGGLDTSDLQVLGTSIGFAVFSATWAAGSAALKTREGAAAWVGAITMALSAASLLTLLAAIWELDESTARTFGSLALLTLAGSHASIVMRAQRPTDGPTVRFLCAASILLASLDSVAAALLVQGAVKIHDTDAFVKAAAAVVIAMLVTTALPPLLRGPRRAVASAPPPPPPLAPPTSAEPVRDWERLLRPAGACCLAAFTAVVGFAFGAATAKPARPVYSSRAYTAPPTPPPVAYTTPPPAPVPDPWMPPRLPAAVEVGRPMSLPRDLQPTEMFRCPALGPTESRADANFEVTEMRRGAGGLCLRVQGSPVPGLYRQDATYNTITLVLRRRGARGPEGDYRVILWALRGGAPRYWITLQPPGGAPPTMGAKPLGRGRFGMSPRQASILVDRSELPRWVLRRSTRWWVRLR